MTPRRHDRQFRKSLNARAGRFYSVLSLRPSTRHRPDAIDGTGGRHRPAIEPRWFRRDRRLAGSTGRQLWSVVSTRHRPDPDPTRSPTFAAPTGDCYNRASLVFVAATRAGYAKPLIGSVCFVCKRHTTQCTIIARRLYDPFYTNSNQ